MTARGTKIESRAGIYVSTGTPRAGRGQHPVLGNFGGLMSITWTASHPLRLVVAVGKDEITSADMLFCLDEMSKAGVIPYRKIFDLTGIATMMSQADLRAAGTRVAALADGKQIGAVAIVVASGAIAELARIFEAAATANRPLQIFRDLYAARAWLDEIAPP